MAKPWVHIIAGVGDCREAAAIGSELFPSVCLRQTLDGDGITSLTQFYDSIETAVSLIRGFGKNLDALLDLFRTFGWGEYAGKSHVFTWYRPESMLAAAPAEFRQVVDIIVGVAKELQVGEEADPNFDPTDEDDWVATRLDVVFACQDAQDAQTVADVAGRLSDIWADEFYSLDVPIDRMDGEA